MSMDVKMAWRNIWRNPRRTLLTIAAIAFACLTLVFMLSFQFGSYETMINASVKIHTGHLQIQAKGYQDKKSMRLVVSDPERFGTVLEGMDGVEAYTFRANAFSLVSSKTRTYGVMVVGIDPHAEARVSRLKKLIRKGTYLSKGDKEGAIVGRLLAKNLKVDLGEELTMVGQGHDGSIAATVFRVRGIYSSGMDEFDRSAVHITLENFQDVFAMGRAVHEVVVIGRTLDKVPGIKRSLEKHIERFNRPLVVLDWQELMPGLIEGIKLDLVSGLIFYFPFN